MGLIDHHIVQLEGALAALEGSHASTAQEQQAQHAFAEQLGAGLASRLQAVSFTPADVTKILACVDSTLASEDLLGQYFKAVQPASISAAQGAVKQALQALQQSDCSDEVQLYSLQQGHQSAARDGEELCSGVLQQLQGLIGQYKDTGKQLTELGEQLGTAREVLATLDEQLQVPPSHAQYEDLVKACCELDELLMSLADLQVAHDDSAHFVHSTSKTSKAVKALHKQYTAARGVAVSADGGTQGTAGKLKYVIEARQAWATSLEAQSTYAAGISALSTQLAGVINSIEVVVNQLSEDADNPSSMEICEPICSSNSQLQQLNRQQDQQLTSCERVKQQLDQLFNLVRASNSSGGNSILASQQGSAAVGRSASAEGHSGHTAAGTPPADLHTALFDADVSNLGEHAAGDVNSSHCCVQAATGNQAGHGSISCSSKRSSRLSMASRAVYSDPGATWPVAAAAPAKCRSTLASVAEESAAETTDAQQLHEHAGEQEAVLQVRSSYQKQTILQSLQPGQEQQQQLLQPVQCPDQQQLTAMQSLLATAVSTGQLPATCKLLSICASLQQLLQQMQVEPACQPAAVAGEHHLSGSFDDLALLDECPALPSITESSDMLKWNNPVFARDSQPGALDSNDCSLGNSNTAAIATAGQASASALDNAITCGTTNRVVACGAVIERQSSGHKLHLDMPEQGLAIAVEDDGSGLYDELATPHSRSDPPKLPSRLESLARPPSSRDMDAAAAAALAPQDSKADSELNGIKAQGEQQQRAATWTIPAVSSQQAEQPQQEKTSSSTQGSPGRTTGSSSSNNGAGAEQDDHQEGGTAVRALARNDTLELVTLDEGSAALDAEESDLLGQIIDEAVCGSSIASAEHSAELLQLPAAQQQEDQLACEQQQQQVESAGFKQEDCGLSDGYILGSGQGSLLADASEVEQMVAMLLQQKLAAEARAAEMQQKLQKACQERQELQQQLGDCQQQVLNLSEQLIAAQAAAAAASLQATDPKQQLCGASLHCIMDRADADVIEVQQMAALLQQQEAEGLAEAADMQQQLQQECQELEQQLAQQQLQVVGISEQLASSQAAVAAERLHAADLQQQLEAVADSAATMQQQCSEQQHLKGLLQQHQDQLEHLQQQLSTANEQLACYKEREAIMTSLQGEMKCLQQQNKVLQQQLAAAQAYCAQHSMQAEDLNIPAKNILSDSSSSSIVDECPAAVNCVSPVQKGQLAIHRRATTDALTSSCPAFGLGTATEARALQDIPQSDIRGVMHEHSSWISSLHSKFAGTASQPAHLISSLSSSAPRRRATWDVNPSTAAAEAAAASAQKALRAFVGAHQSAGGGKKQLIGYFLPDGTVSIQPEDSSLASLVEDSDLDDREPFTGHREQDIGVGQQHLQVAPLLADNSGEQQSVTAVHESSVTEHTAEGVQHQQEPTNQAAIQLEPPEAAANSPSVEWSQAQVGHLQQENATMAVQLTVAQQELQEQTNSKRILQAKLQASDSTVAAAHAQLAALMATATAAETAAVTESSIVTAGAADDLRSAQQQLASQLAVVQQLMVRLEQSESIMAAVHADLGATAEAQTQVDGIAAMGEPIEALESAGVDVALQAAELKAAAEHLQEHTGVVQQLLTACEAAASGSQIAAAGDPVPRSRISDSSSVAAADDAQVGSSRQLQNDLATAQQQLVDKQQQLQDAHDWADLLALGLARIKQVTDTAGDGHKGCSTSINDDSSSKCKEAAAVTANGNSGSAGFSMAAAVPSVLYDLSPAAAQQLVLLHDMQWLTDQVSLLTCERHILQQAVLQQQQDVSRLQDLLWAAEQQQQLQQSTIKHLEDHQMLAAADAVKQLAAAAEQAAGLKQQLQQQQAAAAEAQKRLAAVTQEHICAGQQWLKHQREYQEAAAVADEALAGLQQQLQKQQAALVGVQERLAVVSQEQQQQHQQDRQHHDYAAEAAGKIASLQQQALMHQADAAEAKEHLTELTEQQQAMAAEWQQQELQHLAALGAAAEQIATLQQQQQQQEAGDAVHGFADMQQMLHQQQTAAQTAAKQLATIQAQHALSQEELHTQAAAADAARQQLQSQLLAAETQANATVKSLQSQLQAAQEAAQQVPELQNELVMLQAQLEEAYGLLQKRGPETGEAAAKGRDDLQQAIKAAAGAGVVDGSVAVVAAGAAAEGAENEVWRQSQQLLKQLAEVDKDRGQLLLQLAATQEQLQVTQQQLSMLQQEHAQVNSLQQTQSQQLQGETDTPAGSLLAEITTPDDLETLQGEHERDIQLLQQHEGQLQQHREEIQQLQQQLTGAQQQLSQQQAVNEQQCEPTARVPLPGQPTSTQSPNEASSGAVPGDLVSAQNHRNYAESSVVASLQQRTALLESVLLEVQSESAAKDKLLQELTQLAELRMGAGYARTEELRRLYRDMTSKDAYISRLESRLRAMTVRTPSPPSRQQQQLAMPGQQQAGTRGHVQHVPQRHTAAGATSESTGDDSPPLNLAASNAPLEANRAPMAQQQQQQQGTIKRPRGTSVQRSPAASGSSQKPSGSRAHVGRTSSLPRTITGPGSNGAPGTGKGFDKCHSPGVVSAESCSPGSSSGSGNSCSTRGAAMQQLRQLRMQQQAEQLSTVRTSRAGLPAQQQ